MLLDIGSLTRYTAVAPPDEARSSRPPALSDLLVVMVGNSGESVGCRIQALGTSDGVTIVGCGINNDGLAPRPLTVRMPDGALLAVPACERLVMGGDNPRDQLRDFPLLDQRYHPLLRGIPVYETFPRAGYGGHGHPAISALDIDLHIVPILALLRQALHGLIDDGANHDARSDWARLTARVRSQAANRSRRLRILIVGGGGGSMGNAGHHLLPYLVRHLLQEMGVREYELWGAVLGPQAFAGLTPFVRHNYRALLEALDAMARCGQQRSYINGLEVASQAPPYDQLFLLDDPALPNGGPRVTEVEQEGFFDRAALSLYLLLARGSVWQTIASHTANDRGEPVDGRLRYLHSVRATLATVDRARLQELLAAEMRARLLAAVVDANAAANEGPRTTKANARATTLTDTSAAREFCASGGLSERLAEALLTTGANRPFAPASLQQEADQASLGEQWALLMRVEPVGGGEPLVRANADRVEEAALQQLHRRLAETSASSQPFLLALQSHLRQMHEAVAPRVRDVAQRYDEVQAALHAWQDSTRRQPNLLKSAWSWVLGGDEQLSLPQAIALWNEREQLGAQRLAMNAALALLARISAECAGLLAGMQSLQQQALAQLRATEQQIDALRRPSTAYAPASWQCDAAVIADQLAERAPLSPLAAELLRRLGADGGIERLAGHAQAIAQQSADALLAPLGISELIEIEASATPLDGADPLVLVGQRLLELLAQQPSWRLARGARPQVETVQITPEGEPIYRLDGLSTAAYGGRLDHLGFLQVELNAALDEIQCVREGDAAFRQALAQRNFYVHEALATQGASEAAPEAIGGEHGATTYAAAAAG